MKKVDKTSYKYGDKNKIPRILKYEATTGNSYTIHRHIYCPETWFVSSDELCDRVDLKTNDFVEAEKRARIVIQDLLDKKINRLSDFYKEVTECIER